jgi:hypothetical protein
MDIDLRIIHFEGISGVVDRTPAIALHLLREAIDDIADQVEEEAKRLAPKGKTGELKAHPVDREDTRFGVVADIRGEIEGRRSVRGPGGRFVPGLGTSGRVVASSKITVAEEPRYAKWVHDGTGLFGPRGSLIRPRTEPFMRFKAYGKRWKLATVKGQVPQPFLEKAFERVDDAYFEERFQQLRLEIEAAT